MNDRKPLLTEQEAGEYLAVSKRKIAYLQKEGDIPAVYIGRCKRYVVADLDAYIERMKTGRNLSPSFPVVVSDSACMINCRKA